MNSRVFTIYCLLAIAAAGVFFALHDDPTPSPATATATPPSAPAPSEAAPAGNDADDGDDDEDASAQPIPPPAPGGTTQVMTREVPDPEGGDTPMLPALALQKGEIPWEASIRTVLETQGISDSDRARRLFAMMPGMAVEGRQTAAEEAIQRTPSADYATVALPVLVNPTTYPPSLTVLFADLMERPDTVRLPSLLALARNESHPFFNQARENLEFVTGKEFGTDWAQWDAAIRARLAAGK